MNLFARASLNTCFPHCSAVPKVSIPAAIEAYFALVGNIPESCFGAKAEHRFRDTLKIMAWIKEEGAPPLSETA